MISFRISEGVDNDAFKAEIRVQDWSKVETCENIDEAVTQWETLVLDIVDKHMPIRTKRVKIKQSPWLNEFLSDLMKKRDKIFFFKKKSKIIS